MGLDDRGLQWRLPLGFAAFLTVVVALLTHRWMDSGRFPPAVPVAAVVLIAVLGGVVLWFGQADAKAAAFGENGQPRRHSHRMLQAWAEIRVRRRVHP